MRKRCVPFATVTLLKVVLRRMPYRSTRENGDFGDKTGASFWDTKAWRRGGSRSRCHLARTGDRAVCVVLLMKDADTVVLQYGQ